MIPAPPGPPPGPEAYLPARLLVPRLAALLLGLASVTGAVGWAAMLSPLRLERWPALDTTRQVTFDEPGRYVLYEEGPGLSTRRAPPQVLVSVRSIAGRTLEVRPLVTAMGRSATTYDIGLQEGRAIATIEVDRPGQYIVVTFAASALEPGSGGRLDLRDVEGLPGMALGPEGVPAPWGDLRGLAVLGGLPAVGALTVGLWAQRARPLPVGPVVVGPLRHAA